MLTYTNATEAWNSKRKNATHKTVMRNLRMTMDDRGVYMFEYLNHKYHYNSTTQKYTREEVPFLLASLTPDNLLTFRANITQLHQSAQKRLSTLLGAQVYSDATNYRNYKVRMRIWATRLKPSYGKTMPYHKGMQWKLHPGSLVPECLNPIPDEKISVAKEAISEVKDRTANLRKLTTTMARIGAFDGLIEDFIEHRYFGRTRSDPDINIDDPTAEDAEKVFTQGLAHMNRLSTHVWIGGVYQKLVTDEIVAQYRCRAVSRGMELLRRSIYTDKDAYVFKAA